MYSVVTFASPSWNPVQSTGNLTCNRNCFMFHDSNSQKNKLKNQLTSQLCGSLMTEYKVQNGDPVSVLIARAAAKLHTLVIFGLKPAPNPTFSFGSCEFISHRTYLSQCGVFFTKRYARCTFKTGSITCNQTVKKRKELHVNQI